MFDVKTAVDAVSNNILVILLSSFRIIAPFSYYDMRAFPPLSLS